MIGSLNYGEMQDLLNKKFILLYKLNICQSNLYSYFDRIRMFFHIRPLYIETRKNLLFYITDNFLTLNFRIYGFL